MKSQTIITMFATLALVVGLFAWGYANRGNPATSAEATGGRSGIAGSLAISETFYDFGTISMRDGNVTREFTITNPTPEDVLLSSLITSCMCTTSFIVTPDGAVRGPFGMPGHGRSVPPANETIKAGESRIVRVVFDPNAHGPAGVGRIERVVTMTEATGATVTFGFKALVTP
ncbi:MAG: DUF1573 domain-containing protein [Patescibacteria group bacterium]